MQKQIYHCTKFPYYCFWVWACTIIDFNFANYDYTKKAQLI